MFSVSRVEAAGSLARTAAQSLFDTEPDHLQGVLIALADDEGLPR